MYLSESSLSTLTSRCTVGDDGSEMGEDAGMAKCKSKVMASIADSAKQAGAKIARRFKIISI
jgi:hypothetical protein